MKALFFCFFFLPGIIFGGECIDTKDPTSCCSRLIKYAPSLVTTVASATDCVLSGISIANAPKVDWTFTASGIASCVSFASRACIIQSYLKMWHEKKDLGGNLTAGDLQQLAEENLKINTGWRSICLLLSYVDLAAFVIGCGEEWQKYTDIVSLVCSAGVCILSLVFFFDILCYKDRGSKYTGYHAV